MRARYTISVTVETSGDKETAVREALYVLVAEAGELRAGPMPTSPMGFIPPVLGKPEDVTVSEGVAA
jgi:hypothetical protein